jgi:hypothetical protein
MPSRHASTDSTSSTFLEKRTHARTSWQTELSTNAQATSNASSHNRDFTLLNSGMERIQTIRSMIDVLDKRPENMELVQLCATMKTIHGAWKDLFRFEKSQIHHLLYSSRSILKTISRLLEAHACLQIHDVDAFQDTMEGIYHPLPLSTIGVDIGITDLLASQTSKVQALITAFSADMLEYTKARDGDSTSTCSCMYRTARREAEWLSDLTNDVSESCCWQLKYINSKAVGLRKVKRLFKMLESAFDGFDCSTIEEAVDLVKRADEVEADRLIHEAMEMLSTVYEESIECDTCVVGMKIW